MGYVIGTVNKGAGLDTHYQLLGIIKTLAEANGWTTLRYDTVSADREWIGKSAGLSGTEEIFLGFKTFQSVPGDYYNLTCAVFTGYVSANTFYNQPGIGLSSFPAHNNSITYFLNANAQRITGCVKVATPVYEHFYIGKIFPYARPSEYPSPLMVAGMFNGVEQKRFSDATHQMPYFGYFYSPDYCNLYMRDMSGVYNKVWSHPFTTKGTDFYCFAGPQSAGCSVPADGYYQLEPIVVSQVGSTQGADIVPLNVWGELDGIYFCSGFNNASENVVQIGGNSTIDQTGMTVAQAVAAIKAVSGKAYVVLQNVNRTTWRDFIAMEMA